MDSTRQTNVKDRQSAREQARMDKAYQARLADFAYRRLLNRFEKTGEC